MEPAHRVADRRRHGELMVAYHIECWLRMIVGGINHIFGRCECCGGTDPPDPPGLSKRDAAKLAGRVLERRYEG
jgi:hypothetical protein